MKKEKKTKRNQTKKKIIDKKHNKKTSFQLIIDQLIM